MRNSEGSSASIVVRVLSVKASEPVCVRFLANECQGLQTHRKGERPIPCDGPGECPIGTHRLPMIWKGYAPAEVWDAPVRLWCPVVMEVTEALEEVLRGRSLRGEVWALSRSEERGRSSPVLGLLCQKLDPAAVPPAFDVLPVLLRLYHVSSLRLGVRNPLPPKLSLSPSADAAPVLPAELQAAAGRQLSPEEQETARKTWEQFRRSGYTSLPENAPKATPEAKNGHAGKNGHK